MTLTFKRISEARQHLTDNGYIWAGYAPLTGAETYKAGPLVAFIRKVPFKGIKVEIR